MKHAEKRFRASPRGAVVVPAVKMLPWPGQPIAVPPVFAHTTHRQGDVIAFGEGGRWIDVPAELYLRELLTLDLEDADEVAGFTADYGILGTPEFDQLPRTTFVDDFVFRRQCERRPWPNVAPTPWAGSFWLIHLDQIVHHARFLRAATRFWIAYNRRPLPRSDKVIEADDEILDDWDAAWLSEFGQAPARLESSHILAFAEIVNSGLTTISPRIEVQTRDLAPSFQPRVNLYSALCLQLLNHVTEEAEIRKCGSETCSNFFVRQRGRAGPAGQYRTAGVLYCDKSCASVQTQRERRRKNRKEQAT